MSFILDALKKSEAERNRQSGPTLVDMRIAPPRRRLPIWMLALTVVLLANLVVLAIVLLKDRDPRSTPAPQQTPAPTSALPAQPAGNVLPPPVLHADAPLPGTPDGPATSAGTVAPAVMQPVPTPMPTMAPEPAPPAPPPLPPASTPRAEDALLPSANDLRLAGVGLPELRLALHVYDATPANSYLLLNSQRMRAGDSTAEGVLLERVTESGAVMAWRGQRFRLVAGE